MSDQRPPDTGFEMLRAVFVPVHREGWPFIGIFALASLALGALYGPLGWIGAVATAWCVYFFRDPDRVTPVDPNLVVSPADGVVQAIVTASPPAELDMGAEPLTRISIFLNVFDVHVNRVPVDGIVMAAAYRPGSFVNASLDKASDDNERMAVAIEMADGRMVAVVQIAGLVARRIKCDLEVGQDVRAGARYGIIRFGSRADVYLPAGAVPLVVAGQRAIGGETPIAALDGSGAARVGEVR